MRTSRLAPLLLVLGAIPGCSLGDEPSTPPQLGPSSGDEEAAAKLGFPASATKNTIRVGGGDAAADAAGVANAVFPGTSTANRPTAVVLVDSKDWQAGVTASVLTASPIGAPLLLSDGDELPAVTADTIERLKPKGSDLSKDAQVIRIGDAPARPDGLKAAVIEGKDPYARAAAIDRFFSAARGRPSPNVIVASGRAGRVRDARRRHGRPAPATPFCSPVRASCRARHARPSPSTRSRGSSYSAPRR